MYVIPWFCLYNPFLIILCLKWCEWFLIISRKSPPKIFYINWTDEYQWTFELFLILSYVEKYFMVSAKKWECCFVEINTTWNYKHKILSSLDWTLKNFNYNAVLHTIQKIIFFVFSYQCFCKKFLKNSLFTFFLLHNLHFIYFHPNSYNFKNAVPCLFAAKFSQHFNSGGSTPTG